LLGDSSEPQGLVGASARSAHVNATNRAKIVYERSRQGVAYILQIAEERVVADEVAVTQDKAAEDSTLDIIADYR
jgi:hypothetical protein